LLVIGVLFGFINVVELADRAVEGRLLDFVPVAFVARTFLFCVLVAVMGFPTLDFAMAITFFVASSPVPMFSCALVNVPLDTLGACTAFWFEEMAHSTGNGLMKLGFGKLRRSTELEGRLVL
jgi:hypothetical protein